MSELDMYAILKKLLSKEELSGLSGIVVVEDTNGYVMFNEYHIEPMKRGYRVTSFVTHCNHVFYSLKNSVMWCTLDKRKKVLESNQILVLDKMLEGAIANAELHKHLSEKTKNVDNRTLYFSKLQEDRVKKKHIMKQLDSYAEEVKKWQYQQFATVSK